MMTVKGIAEEFKSTERFLVLRRLGSGGFGVVYQVYDKEHNCVLALKHLNHIDADALYRFKQEFRALSDISHPNLVNLYELIGDNHQWFFTMEMVDGVNFLEYVRSSTANCAPTISHNAIAPESATRSSDDFNEIPMSVVKKATRLYPQLDVKRLRHVLKQLAEGLCALHSLGKLHRDLKPSNVLVANTGRLVVLDFGLVTDLAPGQQSLTLVGTPEFMAPERIAEQPVCEASDWYSVGVMLYEALTGLLPYTDTNPYRVLLKKQSFMPPSPREIADGVPEDLDRLCMELLNRNPEARPSGSEILKRLSQIDEPSQGAAPAPPVISPQPLFIGRRSHLNKIKEAFDVVKKQRRAVIVHVPGRSGMGKSSLVRHFLEEVRRSELSTLVLSGRCYQQESVPFKALDGIVDALSSFLKRLPVVEAEALLPLDILALTRLFPVLNQVEAVAGSSQDVLEIPDFQELRRTAFAAMRELMTRISRKRQLIIYIDDLQWGDLDSAALLGELMRPPNPPPLLFIASYRSEEVNTSPMLKALRQYQATIAQDITNTIVEVDELSNEEARELILTLQGPASGKLDKSYLAAITRESGGSPFFINELVNYTRICGPEHAQAISLSEALQARLALLPENARRLLEIISVASQPLEREVARQAASLDEDQSALTILRSGNLIRVNEQQELETYHDRIRETVVLTLAKENLSISHLSLANALEASGRADAEALTAHYYCAGEHKKAAQYAIVAAEQAAGALAFDRAAHLYRQALEIKEADGQTAELQEKLGHALANAGRGSEAAQAYLAAVDEQNAIKTTELRQRAAEQFLISGHIEEGMAVLDRLMEAFDIKLSETSSLTTISILLRRTLNKIGGSRSQLPDVAEISPHELMKIDTYWAIIKGFWFFNYASAVKLIPRHLLLALKAGDPFRITRALAIKAFYSSTSGWKNRHHTQKLLKEMWAMAESVNEPYILALASFIEAAVAWCSTSDMKHCSEQADRAETIFRNCKGVSWELNQCYHFSLFSKCYLGELRELSERVSVCLKNAREEGNILAQGCIMRASNFISLAADKPDKAREDFSNILSKWPQKSYSVQHYYNLFGQTHTMLYRGETQAAFKMVEEEWEALLSIQLIQNVEYFFIEATHMRAASAMALAASQSSPQPQLLELAERCTRELDATGPPYGKALSMLIKAALAAYHGKDAEAINILTTTEGVFERVHMGLHAAVARWRRGHLMGGEGGRALVAAAQDWMTDQTIKRPDRMADMIAPGRWVAK